MYSGQVQQHGQSSYYSNTQSPSSAMQQVIYIQTLKELILFYQSSNFQICTIRVVLIVVESIHVFVYYLPFCVLISLQVTVPLPSSQLSLPNFGSGGGQPLLALPPTPPQAQPPTINRQPPVSQPYRGIMGPNHSMMQPPTSKVL